MSVPARRPGVAIYARTATHGQGHDPLDQQLTRLREHAATLGVTPAEYVERGASSGSLVNRSEGRRLLHDARAGHLGQVLVATQDRISRRPAALLQSLRELDRAGVYVRALDGSVDTAHPEGRRWLRLLVGMVGDNPAPVREVR